ncbi:serine O-acetyltransferase [Arthrobacter vasquezii]|uniref:serine O-acetyltransferase n=1 Tax=Arthrobacter vasquezii TaxID=2977629 RepID=UPI00384FDAE2
MNKGRLHLQILLILFRIAQRSRSRRSALRPLAPLLVALYRVPALFLYGIDIPTRTVIGRGLSVHHGFGIVIHADSVIGNNVTLRQGVTLGAKAGGRPPVIGDRVDLGAASMVIGSITVEPDAVVGAGAVVTRDVRAQTVVAGNPARPIT